MPNLYVIAGCNGAGKTTASYAVLPEMLECKEFVNADEIAKGLSPFNPGSVAIEAGRLMLRRIHELIDHGVDFAFETTLATRSYFWLNSPELDVGRVQMRVEAGGHNIDQKVVRRRYRSGIKNLFDIYIPVCDYWILLDNSRPPSKVIAKGNRDKTKSIVETLIYKTLKNYE